MLLDLIQLLSMALDLVLQRRVAMTWDGTNSVDLSRFLPALVQEIAVHPEV